MPSTPHAVLRLIQEYISVLGRVTVFHIFQLADLVSFTDLGANIELH